MAIGKSNIKIDINKLNISFGDIKIIEKGQIYSGYSEVKASEYMKSKNIDIKIDLGLGIKNFTAYTMDFSKKYIEINTDYRS